MEPEDVQREAPFALHGPFGQAPLREGESERQLFCEDAFALLDLPEAEFKAMSFRGCAGKYGNVTLDGRHRYTSAPELGGAEVYGKVILDSLACRNSTLWQRTCRP